MTSSTLLPSVLPFSASKAIFGQILSFPTSGRTRASDAWQILATASSKISDGLLQSIGFNWHQKEAELSKIRLGHWIILDPFSIFRNAEVSDGTLLNQASAAVRLPLWNGSGVQKCFTPRGNIRSNYDTQFITMEHSNEELGEKVLLRLLSSTFTLPNHTKAKDG